ncbi:TANC2 isoform 5, partial [Pan troglodytes]
VDHLDKNGQCALVHAALRGHLEVVKFLIQCDWTMAGQQQGVFKKSHAIQQALIAAASMGYTEIVSYLLDLPEKDEEEVERAQINSFDSLWGETGTSHGRCPQECVVFVWTLESHPLIFSLAYIWQSSVSGFCNAD